MADHLRTLTRTLDLPLWDAIHYIRCANEASKSAARLEGVMDRILRNSGLWEDAPEGKSEFSRKEQRSRFG